MHASYRIMENYEQIHHRIPTLRRKTPYFSMDEHLCYSADSCSTHRPPDISHKAWMTEMEPPMAPPD